MKSWNIDNNKSFSHLDHLSNNESLLITVIIYRSMAIVRFMKTWQLLCQYDNSGFIVWTYPDNVNVR